MNTTANKRGWIITFAALGINLIMGVLYSWGVIGKALINNWGWTSSEASLPFTVSAAVFAVTMVFAGKAQDKFGPKIVTILGGLMVGAGLIASGFATKETHFLLVFTFGIISSIGIGLGYSAATPCAMKWFDSSKKGMIAGIVVAGVGLSPVYITPITANLLNKYGINTTFIILGLFAISAVTLFSMFLSNPPEVDTPKTNTQQISFTPKGNDFAWNEVVRTPQFYLLWIMYALAATAGLMLIAHLPKIAEGQASWKAGFWLVVILSVFNALGRLGAGILSDKVGRTRAMMFIFILQALNMFMFMLYTSIPLLIAGSAIAGLAYGAVFSLFPTTTAEFFGMKNLGINYGMVFTGWGVAGVFGAMLAAAIKDRTGVYDYSYVMAGVFLVIAAILVLTLKTPKAKA
jgi:OFA family oxalate/formate antiporter-like MFS transporter